MTAHIASVSWYPKSKQYDFIVFAKRKTILTCKWLIGKSIILLTGARHFIVYSRCIGMHYYSVLWGDIAVSLNHKAYILFLHPMSTKSTESSSYRTSVYEIDSSSLFPLLCESSHVQSTTPSWAQHVDIRIGNDVSIAKSAWRGVATLTRTPNAPAVIGFVMTRADTDDFIVVLYCPLVIKYQYENKSASSDVAMRVLDVSLTCRVDISTTTDVHLDQRIQVNVQITNTMVTW